MTIEEAYIKFLAKVNKNYTNDNLSADRSRFILLFNEALNNFVEWVLEKRNEDEIRYIQKLLVYDKKLTNKGKLVNHQDFELPDNFFSFSNIQAFASSKGCKNQKLQLFEIKQENREEFLHDDFNKPSFKYRETFYSFGENEVKIYIDDFKIDKVLLTYYRYPKQVDIAGYVKEDGTMSTNIDPELDDKVIDRVITACSKNFSVNNDNLQKFQFEKDRTFSKI